MKKFYSFVSSHNLDAGIGSTQNIKKGYTHETVKNLAEDKDDVYFEKLQMKSIARFKAESSNNMKIQSFNFLGKELVNGDQLDYP